MISWAPTQAFFIPELGSLFLRSREGARKRDISNLEAIISRDRWTSETSRYRIQGLTCARREEISKLKAVASCDRWTSETLRYRIQGLTCTRGRRTTTRTHDSADSFNLFAAVLTRTKFFSTIIQPYQNQIHSYNR